MRSRRLIAGAFILLLAAVSALPAAAAPAPAAGADSSKLLDTLSSIIKVIEQKNVLLSSNSADAIVNGLLASLDPESAIFNEDETQAFKAGEQGLFCGIGIQSRPLDKGLFVASVIPDSPADAAGIKQGDVIKQINGKPAADAAVELGGQEGTTLTLLVSEGNAKDKSSALTLKIEKLQTPVIDEEKTWLGNIVYMRLNGLYRGAGQLCLEALGERVTTNTTGLILDLRMAGGMDFVSVSDIASMFSPAEKILFKELDGQGKEVALHKTHESLRLSLPTMVLTGSDTKGASEALAAVLQEFKGVILIGSPTAGDDRLREFIPLGDGRFLRLATGRLDVSPAPAYRDKGVQPDIAISPELAEKEAALYAMAQSELDDEKSGLAGLGRKSELSEHEKMAHALRRELRGDPVLKRAVDLLLGLQALNVRVP